MLGESTVSAKALIIISAQWDFGVTEWQGNQNEPNNLILFLSTCFDLEYLYVKYHNIYQIANTHK